jgi:uncharacterized protein YjbI with pentapeptide repeats
MVETLLVGGIISALVAFAISFAMFRIQRRALEAARAQQSAWERAQEFHQAQWQVLQERRILDLEKRVTLQVQQSSSECQAGLEGYTARAEALQSQFEQAIIQIRTEYELTRLQRIEDTPLPERKEAAKQPFAGQTLRLQGADLSQRDLSSRYLGYADLQGARLTGTNLFMTDLSRANLSNADLSQANLSAANLSHADLRGANLNGANFLVTDLHGTLLAGADLRNVHNLTPEQLHAASYDSSTQFDAATEAALSLPPTQQELPATQDIVLSDKAIAAAHRPILAPSNKQATTSTFEEEGDSQVASKSSEQGENRG